MPLNGQGVIKYVISDSIQIIDYINKPEIIEFDAGQNLGLSLINTLENQSFATIRTGGPSVLSTILHRGMASRHIAFLWGGFNIQSVVNGTFDIGLIRNTFDQAKYYRSGLSATIGNASLAGAFSLKNALFDESSNTINLSASSAKNVSITALNKLKTNKYFHHIAVNYTSDQNNYSYKNGGIKLTQKLAKFEVIDANYQGTFIISDKISITGGSWLQKAKRNIPPTKTSVQIEQKQKDKNYRGFLQLDYFILNKSKLSLRSGYFNETIDYESPGISSISTANIYNVVLDFIHESGLSLSGQYRGDNVDASFFVPKYRRTTWAFLADYKMVLKTFKIGVSIRPEWVGNEFQPLTFGFRLNKDLSKNLVSTIIYNKGYTLPSFNDLYWPAGGNPNLNTERSHEFDLGFNWKYNSKSKDFIKLNLFYNVIDDWIQWTPIEGFFQPTNQRKVRNVGFEFAFNKVFNLNQESKFYLRLLYGFTDSRLAKHYFDPANEGKRTIFVPAHKLTGQLSFVRKSWQVNIKPLYYGKRFNTVDNSAFVSGYFLTDFEILKNIDIHKNGIILSLAIENAFNNDYENIRFYPMPLRVFRIGINFKH